MEANKVSCQTCGSISFTKTDKTAKCDYCGAEYDISQMQARGAKLDAEQKALDSLADDVSRLRQLADQKEAERQKTIDEEKRRQEEAQKAYEAQQKKIQRVSEDIKKAMIATFILLIIFLLLYGFYIYSPY